MQKFINNFERFHFEKFGLKAKSLKIAFTFHSAFTQHILVAILLRFSVFLLIGQ